MDENTIVGVLCEYQDSRRPLGLHESVFFNMDFVLKELKAAKEPFENFVWLPSATI
jgi:hypothetical protein